MKKIICLAFIFSGVLAYAQPTITSNSNNIVVGDVFKNLLSNYAIPDSAGPNRFWDFTDCIPVSYANYTAVTVGSTPYQAGFANTGANVCLMDGTAYNYYNVSPSSEKFIGTEDPSALIVYSNTYDVIRFPFNYNNSYVDTAYSVYSYAVFVGFVITNTNQTTYTVTYDGYGTLALPTGTYDNVARVHTKSISNTSYELNPFTPTLEVVTKNTYDWYLNGNHQPIATIFKSTSPTAGSNSGTSYLNSIATRISSNEPNASSAKLFPNPAKNYLNITSVFGLEFENIEISNLEGNVIHSEKINSGKNLTQIDVSAFKTGVYFLSVNFNDGSVTHNKFVIE